MDEHIDYQFRVSYLVLDPEGKQVWASNYKHLADADAFSRDRSKKGHTVIEMQPGQELPRCPECGSMYYRLNAFFGQPANEYLMYTCSNCQNQYN